MNYEEKVSTRADVKALYEKVKENPAVEKYRGYTETKSYGWDEEAGNYIKCDGTVWFDNPAFDKDFVMVGKSEAPEGELHDEQLSTCLLELSDLQEKLSLATEEKEALFLALNTAKAEVEAALCARDSALRTLLELQKQLQELADKVGAAVAPDVV